MNLSHKIIFFNKDRDILEQIIKNDGGLDGKIPSASVIKLIVLLYAIKNLDLTKKYNVCDIKKTNYPSLLGIHNEKDINIYDMLKYISFLSDNDCYNFILDKISFDEINKFGNKYEASILTDFSDKYLNEEGLQNTMTINGMMDLIIDISNENLGKKLLSECYFERAFSNIINYTKVYHKTGSLCGYYHDLGWYEFNGDNIYVLALTKGYSKSDAEELMKKEVENQFKLNHQV